MEMQETFKGAQPLPHHLADFVAKNSFLIPPILSHVGWGDLMWALGGLGDYVRSRGPARERSHLHVDPLDSTTCPPGLDFLVSPQGKVIASMFDTVQVRVIHRVVRGIARRNA